MPLSATPGEPSTLCLFVPYGQHAHQHRAQAEGEQLRQRLEGLALAGARAREERLALLRRDELPRLVVREDVVVAAYHLRREVRQRARGDGVEDARGPSVAVVLLEGAARPRGLGDVGDDDAEGQRQREDEADAPDL